jgi:ABC-type molybdate transport system substrate-binding protein
VIAQTQAAFHPVEPAAYLASAAPIANVTAGGTILNAACAITTTASSAELHVLSGRGFSPVLDALRDQFEGASGHKLTIQYEAVT